MGTAIVTGAASGIGQATAMRLAKRMKVVAADRDAAGLAATVGTIEAEGEEKPAFVAQMLVLLVGEGR